MTLPFMARIVTRRAMNEELEQEIADRTRTEVEKSKLQKQLFHVQKMEAIGVLAGGIAHDFNNILTAIIGYGNLALKRLKDDPQSRKFLENILTSSSRAVDLTRGLLTFSRKQMIDPKPTRLDEIVKSAESLLLPLIGETIEFKTVLTDAEVIVMADSGQIGQVLMNLATNARDAMPDGGVLTITTSVVELTAEFFKSRPIGRSGRYAALSVIDTAQVLMGMFRKKCLNRSLRPRGSGKAPGSVWRSCSGSWSSTTATCSSKVIQERERPSRSICRSFGRQFNKDYRSIPRTEDHPTYLHVAFPVAMICPKPCLDRRRHY